MKVLADPAASPGAREGFPGQGRIPFRLRIGVIGHRVLPEGGDLAEAVSAAIDLAISTSGYPKDGLPSTPLRLTAVSSLAEGADRLVANEILQRNIAENKLVCVLPVSDTEENLNVYRADFTSEESVKEFDELYKSAWQRLQPPDDLVPAEATPQEKRDAGYQHAGRLVALNSDVVIIIWDGKPFRGTGGTADTVHWMRERDIGNPDSDGPTEAPPKQARKGLAALFGPSAPDEASLEAQGPLRIIINTSGGYTPVLDKEWPYAETAEAARKRITEDLDKLDEFNRKSYPPANWERSVAQMMDDLAPARYREQPRLNRIIEQIAPYLNRADQMAKHAQHGFRLSSYLFFASTALATIVAAIEAVVFPHLWELTIGELALLIASVGIVRAEQAWRNNNKHWFVYRFLAERLRSASYLLAVGITPETGFDIGGTTEDPTQNRWVRRAFTGVLGEGDSRQQDISEDLETLNSLIRSH